MANLKLEHIDKIYQNGVQAVFDFNLEVKDKEFVVFVGPSGCGKSTTLRMIAGLEEISAGNIFIDDRLVNTVMPKDRDISMVFQNYALYPHMSNFDNMAFGLKIRKVPEKVKDSNGNQIYVVDKEKIKDLKKEIASLKKEKAEDYEAKIASKEEEIRNLEANPSKEKVHYRHMSKEEISTRVNAAAEILGLTQYLKRKPGALSGGQRQRVALGRAIVRNPRLFLMDEPLSNLDAKLRVQMRKEIINIHQKVGATTIYVTHDQTEAMTMADRIVIMKDGYIQQVGTPKEVYADPANMFVGGFIGSPAMNFFNGKYENGKFIFENSDQQIFIDENIYPYLKNHNGEEMVLGVRPEHTYPVGFEANKNPTDPLKAKVSLVELLGSEEIVYADMDSQSIISKITGDFDYQRDSDISFSFDMKKLYFFEREGGKRIKDA